MSELDPLTTQNAFMPTGLQTIKAVEYFDGAIKYEIILTSFHSFMKFTSLLEIAICLIMAGFFLRAPFQMGFYFFHILHYLRAIMALYICSKVTFPQNFIGVLRKEAENDKNSVYNFEEYAVYVE